MDNMDNTSEKVAPGWSLRL